MSSYQNTALPKGKMPTPQQSQQSTLELKSNCSAILMSLQNHEHGWVFATPVDPV